ncbi:MAG: diaminopimelate epimerase [Nitrospirota bacterium]
MPFTKMHGLGNDFVVIDCRTLHLDDLPALATRLCDRRFGIGADQILLLGKSDIADFSMKIFNADGSEVEMCGNGIRCLAKYIWDRNLSAKKILEIDTLAGVIRPEKAGDLVRVDMGEPVFEPEKIPVNIRNSESGIQNPDKKMIVDYPLQIDDREFKVTCVSMGNPHAVIVVDNVSDFPVAYYGPKIEHHHIFPKRTNVEFINALNSSEIRMRVWERGSGETTACGTGASAAAVAAHLKKLVGRNVIVHLIGGDLVVDWAADNRIYMTGPAVEVFEGVYGA